MEITAITVFNKLTKELITKVFKDGGNIKEITSDEFEVIIETKDSPIDEPNG